MNVRPKTDKLEAIRHALGWLHILIKTWDSTGNRESQLFLWRILNKLREFNRQMECVEYSCRFTTGGWCSVAERAVYTLRPQLPATSVQPQEASEDALRSPEWLHPPEATEDKWLLACYTAPLHSAPTLLPAHQARANNELPASLGSSAPLISPGRLIIGDLRSLPSFNEAGCYGNRR